MELYSQALDLVHGLLAGAPHDVRVIAMIAFVLASLVAWAAVSYRLPKLGVFLNAALLVRVACEVHAWIPYVPTSPERGLGMMIESTFASYDHACSVVGEGVFVLVALVGMAIAVFRLLAREPEPIPRASVRE